MSEGESSCKHPSFYSANLPHLSNLCFSDFLDGEKICADIEQLRFTQNFDFLDEFFSQGTGGGNSGLCATAACYLKKPREESDFDVNESDGFGWRVTNYVLEQVANSATDAFSLTDAICPDDTAGKFVAGCAKIEAAAFLISVSFRLVSATTTFDLRECRLPEAHYESFLLDVL